MIELDETPEKVPQGTHSDRPPLPDGTMVSQNETVFQTETLEDDVPTGMEALSPEEVAIIQKLRSGDVIPVLSYNWHRMVYSLMMGAAHTYLGTVNMGVNQAGLMNLGRVRGGQTLAECQTHWEETKAYIEKLKKEGKM